MRPIEPLSLPEHQRVMVTIDVCHAQPEFGAGEMEGSRAHSHEYLGLWVALEGNRLVAHGPDALAVRDEARRLGVPVPLMHRPTPTEPHAFWS